MEPGPKIAPIISSQAWTPLEKPGFAARKSTDETTRKTTGKTTGKTTV